MSYIVLGLILGLGISSLKREFRLKEITGYSLLAAIGGLYGNFLMTVVEESLSLHDPALRGAIIVAGALLLCAIKALLGLRVSVAKH